MTTASPLRAAAWMMGALVSFSVMAVAAREASVQLDTFQLMLYRSVFAFLIVLAFVLASRDSRRLIRTQRPILHVGRNTVHFVGQFGWFHAVALIPFVQVIAIEFTTPLWVALLAPLFLGERMTWNRLVAAVLGFSGVLLILHPELAVMSGGSVLNVGYLAAIVAAWGFAGAMLCTKHLTMTEAPLTILFYMGVVQVPISIVAVFATTEIVLPSGIVWLHVVLVAICGMSAHYSITRALAHADAVVVAPLDFIRLPLMAAVGYLVYAEALEIWVAAGAVLIVAASYGNVLIEGRRAASKSVPR